MSNPFLETSSGKLDRVTVSLDANRMSFGFAEIKRFWELRFLLIIPPARSSILILILILISMVQPPPPLPSEPPDPASATRCVFSRAVDGVTQNSNPGVFTCGVCTPGVCYAVACAVCRGGSQSKLLFSFCTHWIFPIFLGGKSGGNGTIQSNFYISPIPSRFLRNLNVFRPKNHCLFFKLIQI